MLILLRIIFGALMYWAYREAKLNAVINPMYGDISNAYWVAVVTVLALANGAVWAPFFGEKIGDPLAGGTVNAEYKEPKNWIIKLIRWLEARRCRAFVRWLCFLEGVRKPFIPTAFVIGMENSREGSWLEKVFAREVFRFNNAQQCPKAYMILKRHGVNPGPHASPAINLVLISQEHEIKPDPAKVEVPQAPQAPKPERNERIKLGLD
jgi:hypothetical protein